MEFIRIDITDEQRAEATGRFTKVLANSILEGDGDYIGSLGEIVARDYYGAEDCPCFDWDLKINGITVDVKTRKCGIPYVPTKIWSFAMPPFNMHQKCKYYMSTHITTDFKVMFITGFKEPEEFYKKARYNEKGSKCPERSDGWPYPVTCYTMLLPDLDWPEEFNPSRYLKKDCIIQEVMHYEDNLLHNSTTMENTIDLNLLRQTIPCQYRVGSLTGKKDKFNVLAYIDARDAMDLLDKVVGPGNWQDDYFTLPGRTGLFCKIGIKIATAGPGGGSEWIWKVDTGTSGDIEEEKSEVSDALKRAAVKWGIGRFLYEMPTIYVGAKVGWKDKEGKDHYVPIDTAGNQIWNLTEFITRTGKYAGVVPSTPPAPNVQPGASEVASRSNPYSKAKMVGGTTVHECEQCGKIISSDYAICYPCKIANSEKQKASLALARTEVHTNTDGVNDFEMQSEAASFDRMQSNHENELFNR